MGKTFKLILCLIFAVPLFLWIWIHLCEWNSAQGEYHIKEVCVKQDTVCDYHGIRQVKSLCAEIPEQKYVCDFILYDDGYGYKTEFSHILDMIYIYGEECDDILVSVTIVRRANKTAIVGYRYYDTKTNTYHDAQTKEASLWWAKPEPNFIECFFSLDFLNHLL